MPKEFTLYHSFRQGDTVYVDEGFIRSITKEGNNKKALEVMEQHLNDIEREMYLILRKGVVKAP